MSSGTLISFMSNVKMLDLSFRITSGVNNTEYTCTASQPGVSLSSEAIRIQVEGIAAGHGVHCSNVTAIFHFRWQ